MPVAIVVLGFAIFAQGTSELMIAGLLPEIASDLDVTISQAGLLVSGFALGMLIGAPVLAVVTLRWRRRIALLLFLGLFVLAHIAGALAPGYHTLLVSRFVGAFVYAGFWAVAASTAMALVPVARRGRAMSIVAGGLTVATVIGLPAGTWIGQNLGWRGTFWVVTALSAVAMIGVLAKVPDITPQNAPRVRDELRGLGVPRLWLSYAMTSVSTAALLVTFTYLAAMLVENTGMDARWVPLVLLGYGIGALAGMALGGRAADTRPIGVLAAGFTGLLLVSVLIAVLAEQVVPVVVLAVVLGFTGFGVNPALNSRVFGIAPGAPTLAAAGSTAAFNVGITVGPWLGGLALTAGYGYPAIPWIGAALASAVLVLLVVEVRARRAATGREAAGTREPALVE
ncbi:Cmx/CmrA family chloramphenicol efflux MFS transporter [Saccharopolyspora sp. NPDC049426]|uniref:Cmx/CmrA family chloramphenicol efflux MFS transporter n=1 Tax=Saccharopolyspora sp. NPDC049426 TaxID=3155652 RepID=UPI00343D4F24